jgi:hypothetical protein
VILVKEGLITKELIVVLVGQLIAGVSLTGIIQGDLQGFTDAVVAVVSGLISVVTGVAYIIAHLDFKKKQLDK